jgi:hypothetical protein
MRRAAARSPADNARAYDWITAVTSSAGVVAGRDTVGDALGEPGAAVVAGGGGIITGTVTVVSGLCSTGVRVDSTVTGAVVRVVSGAAAAARPPGVDTRPNAGASTRRCGSGGGWVGVWFALLGGVPD